MTWDKLRDSTPGDILAWSGDQPWARAMTSCTQDEGWHSEGDVWTHTKMVCAQLPMLDERASLTPHDRTVLLFTALLHDSAKPLTSQVDPATGRITSPKHAVKGERLARAVLRDLGCDLATREEIAGMVRYHGRPAFVLEKPEPAHEAISMSWLVSNRLLYLFALADTRGRSTAEMGRPEETIHLWRLVAEENGCFNRPYPFVNDQARFLFYRRERPNLHHVPHEDYRCTVTMLSGLPGVGKDSWLEANRPDLHVVSLDDLRGELGVEPGDDQGRVIQAARERSREHLRAGHSFAFNATNLLKQTRRRWIDLFADYEARIEVVYIEPPMAVILDRNRRRERPVPEKVIPELADRCEPPTLTEAHGLTTGVGQERRR
ncbi:MAG: phosphohydrolase [Planctomycetes bacterium SCN 63-9]|nr:MAG: phosphohydrolase [Planctomycetes bacterium SCN 63-9]